MHRAIVIKTYGDAVLCGAIKDGIMRGTIPPRPASESIRRVAMHQHTPEEWAQMTADAREDYACLYRQHGRLYGAILGVWALAWSVVFGWVRYFQSWNREV